MLHLNKKNLNDPLFQRQFSDYHRMTEQETLKEDEGEKIKLLNWKLFELKVTDIQQVNLF